MGQGDIVHDYHLEFTKEASLKGFGKKYVQSCVKWGDRKLECIH